MTKPKLRRYVGEYFDLIRDNQDAYVPRIFVNQLKKYKRLMTSISWIDIVPFVFPPTDYVFLCESLDTQWHVKILGYASTSKVVKKLSPYLDCVDKFDLAKKILRGVIQPLSELDFVIVDMITGFQEEQLYYDKYNQTIKP